MENFLEFWHLYVPQKQYHNRYLACKRLWETMDEPVCGQIIIELKKEASQQPPVTHTKNPYFYLIDWEPAQPQWLSPREVGSLLAQHVPLAVCRNPKTNCFGTVTRTEAEAFGLEVHHWM